MKILYVNSYITILSLYNCLINLPIKINDQNYPLPINIYSYFVRILVSGHIYRYITILSLYNCLINLL